MNRLVKWSVYGAVPLCLSLALQLMYFSGNLVLQRLVCPKLPPLPPDAYREFGLLENLQNVFVLAIVIFLLIGAIRSVHRVQRVVFVALTLFSTFIFLEEIDYGTHFYAYAQLEDVAGWFEPARSDRFQALLAQSDFTATPFNLHNRGDLTDVIKGVAGAVMLLLFVVAPFLTGRIKNPWFHYLAPDRFTVITVVVMVVLRLVTHQLGNLDAQWAAMPLPDGGASTREVGAMNNNLSEFRELTTYYLFLVYLAVVVFFRRAPQHTVSGGETPQPS